MAAAKARGPAGRPRIDGPPPCFAATREPGRNLGRPDQFRVTASAPLSRRESISEKWFPVLRRKKREIKDWARIVDSTEAEFARAPAFGPHWRRLSLCPPRLVGNVAATTPGARKLGAEETTTAHPTPRGRRGYSPALPPPLVRDDENHTGRSRRPSRPDIPAEQSESRDRVPVGACAPLRPPTPTRRPIGRHPPRSRGGISRRAFRPLSPLSPRSPTPLPAIAPLSDLPPRYRRAFPPRSCTAPS